MTTRTKPDGYLSLVVHNPVSRVLSAIVHDQDPTTAALRMNETTAFVHTLDVTVSHYPRETVLSWLQAAGLELVTDYGIRCLCDYANDNDRKTDPVWYQDMLDLELQVAESTPFRDIAKFVHILARKTRA